MAADAKKAECRAALEKMALAPQPPKRFYGAYRRACEIGTKLQGCGAFKSTAVTAADEATMEALMICEMGGAEACEGIATKAPPLQAWLSSLKGQWCKKGESALCENFKQCRQPAQWTCETVGATPDAPKLCGCAPKCDNGVAIRATGKTWPDGSKRGKFSCN